MNKRALVIPCSGIGDALMMMVASHTLAHAGYEVATVHPKLLELRSWFACRHTFLQNVPEGDLSQWDLVIVQHDDRLTTRSLIERCTSPLSLFYASYKPGKHLPLKENDFVFDRTQTMVQNIALCTAKLTKTLTPCTDNGLIPLHGLTHRSKHRRVLIQPYSQDPDRTWLLSRYARVAKRLVQRRFCPVFILTEEQKKSSSFWNRSEITALTFPTLSDLAAYVYESDAVIGNESLLPHLASNLNIPHITIAKSASHMPLWRPGWLQGTLLVPPSWIPNIKHLRLRDNQWRRCITVSSVLSAFQTLIL